MYVKLTPGSGPFEKFHFFPDQHFSDVDGTGGWDVWGGWYQGKKKFVYLKWASPFWLSIQNFIFPLEENLFGFGWGVTPDHPPPPPPWISTSLIMRGDGAWCIRSFVQVQQVLLILDTNGDGSVDFHELMACGMPAAEMKQREIMIGDPRISHITREVAEQLYEDFCRMDEDNNRYLSVKEIKVRCCVCVRRAAAAPRALGVACFPLERCFECCGG